MPLNLSEALKLQKGGSCKVFNHFDILNLYPYLQENVLYPRIHSFRPSDFVLIPLGYP